MIGFVKRVFQPSPRLERALRISTGRFAPAPYERDDLMRVIQHLGERFPDLLFGSEPYANGKIKQRGEFGYRPAIDMVFWVSGSSMDFAFEWLKTEMHKRAYRCYDNSKNHRNCDLRPISSYSEELQRVLNA